MASNLTEKEVLVLRTALQLIAINKQARAATAEANKDRIRELHSKIMSEEELKAAGLRSNFVIESAIRGLSGLSDELCPTPSDISGASGIPHVSIGGILVSLKKKGYIKLFLRQHLGSRRTYKVIDVVMDSEGNHVPPPEPKRCA